MSESEPRGFSRSNVEALLKEALPRNRGHRAVTPHVDRITEELREAQLLYHSIKLDRSLSRPAERRDKMRRISRQAGALLDAMEIQFPEGIGERPRRFRPVGRPSHDVLFALRDQSNDVGLILGAVRAVQRIREWANSAEQAAQLNTKSKGESPNKGDVARLAFLGEVSVIWKRAGFTVGASRTVDQRIDGPFVRFASGCFHLLGKPQKHDWLYENIQAIKRMG